MKMITTLLICLLTGCTLAPKQLSPNYRYAYRWTMKHCRTSNERYKARHLWNAYVEAKAEWEWAEYNPPSVTGFTNHENWVARDRMIAADKKVFEFVDTLK